jgi:hypothetical protein
LVPKFWYPRSKNSRGVPSPGSPKFFGAFVGLGPLLQPDEEQPLTTSGLAPASRQSGPKTEKSHFSKVDFAIFWGANPPSDFVRNTPRTHSGQSPVGPNFKIRHPTGRFPDFAPLLFSVRFFPKFLKNSQNSGGRPRVGGS